MGVPAKAAWDSVGGRTPVRLVGARTSSTKRASSVAGLDAGRASMPLDTSTAHGSAPAHASNTLSGVSPPASSSGRVSRRRQSRPVELQAAAARLPGAWPSSTKPAAPG
jgi:hypothetical protein